MSPMRKTFKRLQHSQKIFPMNSEGARVRQSSVSSSSASHSSDCEGAPLEEVDAGQDAEAGAQGVRRHIQPQTVRNWHSFRFTWVPPKTSRQNGA